MGIGAVFGTAGRQGRKAAEEEGSWDKGRLKAA